MQNNEKYAACERGPMAKLRTRKSQTNVTTPGRSSIERCNHNAILHRSQGGLDMDSAPITTVQDPRQAGEARIIKMGLICVKPRQHFSASVAKIRMEGMYFSHGARTNSTGVLRWNFGIGHSVV